jgi:hypothetical protein
MRRWPGAVVLAAAAMAATGVETSGMDRVRAPRRDAAVLLQSALEESRTVREIVVDLSATDVIVYVEVARYPSVPRAATVLLSAVSDARYLLISVNPDHDRIGRIAYLGHELQHALEIARHPHVRDQVSLRRLFQRIGTDPGAVADFETEAADAVGRRVWLEASAAQARRDRATAHNARPMRSWSFSR